MNQHLMPEPLSSLQKQETSGFLEELWDWAKSIIFAFVFVMLLHWFVFVLSPIEGHSMEPTLKDNQWLFVNKLVYRFQAPRQGDVIVMQEPGILREEPFYLVKRVVAGPGDIVEIRNQSLYVNHLQIEEAYTDSIIEDEVFFDPIELTDHQYFVLGDNRHKLQSRDSRSFGPIQKEHIIGKAQFIIWPFSDWDNL
jgi:signal peptidase I